MNSGETKENDRAEEARQRVRDALERFWESVRRGKGPRERAYKRGKGGGR